MAGVYGSDGAGVDDLPSPEGVDGGKPATPDDLAKPVRIAVGERER